MVRQRHRLTVVLLLTVVLPARAKERELGDLWRLTTTVDLAAGYDDDALLGRRGQFLNGKGPLGGPSTDYAALPALELALARPTPGGDGRLRVDARLTDAQLRTVGDLAGWDAAANVAWDERLGTTVLTPEVGLRYHAESPEWTYRLVEPSLRAVHTFDAGVRADLSYRYTLQQFPSSVSGADQAKNRYANVDFDDHELKLELRDWLTEELRVEVVLDGQLASYGGNLSATLADYAGLAPGTWRRDLFGDLAGGVGYALSPHLFVRAAGRLQDDRSNSEAFTFVALRGEASALYQRGGQALYAALDYGRYDFPLERFDRRYTNTRLDFRRELDLAYRFAATDALVLEATFRRFDAVSNDCATFSPQRDQNNLPVYSKSYSCFSRDLVDVSARWEL